MDERGQVAVLDASALAAIEIHVPQPSVFGGMMDLVEKEQLTFCDQVIDELHHISRKGPAHFFCKGSRSARVNVGADYATVQEVVLRHNLVDHAATFEQCSPYVLAQALEMRILGFDVTVVTADTRKKRPPFVGLHSAAKEEGFALLDPENFLSLNRIS